MVNPSFTGGSTGCLPSRYAKGIRRLWTHFSRQGRLAGRNLWHSTFHYSIRDRSYPNMRKYGPKQFLYLKQRPRRLPYGTLNTDYHGITMREPRSKLVSDSPIRITSSQIDCVLYNDHPTAPWCKPTFPSCGAFP